MLRGLDIMFGGGCGPSGPRSNRASHLNSAPLCFLFRVTLMVDDTFTGDRTTLMSQFVLFSDRQPVTSIEAENTK